MEGTAFAQFKWPERSSKRKGAGPGSECPRSFSLSLLCHLPTISLDLSPQEPAISQLAACDCLAPLFPESQSPLSHGEVIRQPSTLCVGSGWRRLVFPHGPGLSGQAGPAVLTVLTALLVGNEAFAQSQGGSRHFGVCMVHCALQEKVQSGSVSGRGQSSLCSSLHHFTQLVSCSCTQYKGLGQISVLSSYRERSSG